MKYLLNGQETDRLKFRRLQDDDFEAWTELFRDGYSDNGCAAKVLRCDFV